MCPALLANRSLIALQATIAVDVFENHGGIIALKLLPKQHLFFRIWLSDSGRCILRFDKFDKQNSKHTQKELCH